MTITAEQFKRIFKDVEDPATWASAVSAAWERFGIASVNARAGFLGICGNETGGFTGVKQEDTRWSADQMVKLFKIPRAKADELAKKSGEARANFCYAGKIGNGNEASGDGFRFRGRGIIQLTGRENYRACGKALGLDLTADPDSLVDKPERSAAAAAWFIVKRAKILPGLNKADEDSFLAAAEVVGHTLPAATKRRLAFRRAALRELGGDAAPAAPAAAGDGFSKARVTRMQKALNTAGADPALKTDGKWGPLTQKAADRFRKQRSLPKADGPTEDLAQALGV